MDMIAIDKSGKRPESSALEILDRVKPEDPVERMQRLEKEIRERRAFQLRVEGVLAEIRRLLNSLEEEGFIFIHTSCDQRYARLAFEDGVVIFPRVKR